MEVKEEPLYERYTCEDQIAAAHAGDIIPSVQNTYTGQYIPHAQHSTEASVVDHPQENFIHCAGFIQIKSEPLDELSTQPGIKLEVLENSHSTEVVHQNYMTPVECHNSENYNINSLLTEQNFPIVYGSIQVKEENLEGDQQYGSHPFNNISYASLSNFASTWRHDSSISDDGMCPKQKGGAGKTSKRKGKQRPDKQSHSGKCRAKTKKSAQLKISKSLYDNNKVKSPKTSSGRKSTERKNQKAKKSALKPKNISNIQEDQLTFYMIKQHEIHNGLESLPAQADNSKSVSGSSPVKSYGNKKPQMSQKKHFSCGLCENRFSQLLELTSHMKEHTLARNSEIFRKQSKWVCENCGRMFSSAKNLKHHCSLKLCENKKRHKLHIQKQKLSSISDRKKRALLKKQIARKNLPSKYSCDQCEKRFKFQYEVRYHKKIYHSNVRPAKCTLCDKTFVHHHTLKYHMRRHTNDRPFQCLTCDKAFYSRTSLKQHAFKHSDTKEYKCEICGDEFRYRPSLFSHMKIHEGYKPYECTHCQKGFRTSNALKSHTANVHMTLKVFSCTECGISFDLKSALNEHAKTHSAAVSSEETNALIVDQLGELNVEGNNNDVSQPMLMTLSPASSERYKEKIRAKKDQNINRTNTKNKVKRNLVKDTKLTKAFQCPECLKTFSHQGYLAKHMKLHTGENIFKCRLCNIEFSSQPKLNAHNQSTHRVNGTYPCTECKKAFSIMSQLNSHMMTHTGYRPYKCEICGKGFRNSTMVKDHMAKHTGERAYKCQFCDKTFKYKHQIRNHEKAHAKDRPFICDICGRGFNYQSYLKTHMREHTGERPFKCTECDKCFKQRPHLVTHMRTHTGEKPFQCQVCHKRFSQGHHLKAHHLQHHVDQC